MFGVNKLRADVADILLDHKKAIEQLHAENRDIRKGMLMLAKVDEGIINTLAQHKINSMVDEVPEDIKKPLKSLLEEWFEDEDDKEELTSALISKTMKRFKEQGIKIPDAQVMAFPNFEEMMESGVLDESIQALIDNGIVEDCGDSDCKIHGTVATKKRKAHLAKKKK